jgi:hypothetical protein
MSDKAKYSYLAGIIDGEGCLTIGAGRKGKVTNYNSIIMVTSTSEQLVKWLQHNFGGNYYKSGRIVPRSKPAFIWRFLKHKEIELLLLAILPYLIIKREQAIILLEFVRLPRKDVPEKRNELFQKMKLLNQRGIDNVETNTQDMGNNSLKIESELTSDSKSAPVVIQVSYTDRLPNNPSCIYS